MCVQMCVSVGVTRGIAHYLRIPIALQGRHLVTSVAPCSFCILMVCYDQWCILVTCERAWVTTINLLPAWYMFFLQVGCVL